MAKQDEGAHVAGWLGYSCPGCHTLFRVARSSVGQTVACPACGEVSLIPERESKRMPGMDGESPACEDGPRGEGGPRQVRRKVKARLVEELREEPAWEQEAIADRPAEADGLQHRLIWVTVSLLLLFLGTAAVVMCMGPVGREATREEQPADGDDDSKTSSEWAGEEEESGVPRVERVEIESVLGQIEACVRPFLEARSVEEMAQWVRGGEAMRKRMEEYYQHNEFVPASYRSIAADGKVQMSGALWSVDIDLRDGLPKAIAVEQTDAGFLVDWESWVGWGEMRWEDFLAKKPAEPVFFRVVCGAVDYYNFEFADDREWESFRIVSPDRAHTLYGYVARYSLAGRLLRDPAGRGELQAVRVKLKFPEAAGTHDQVLIDEVVGSGWVEDVR